jgi:hypothetical protein
LARYEHAEEWKILHAQDAWKLYIHGTEKRRVVVVVGVAMVVVVMVEDSRVRKEAERSSGDAW